jgi:hypothetical protein
MGGRSVNKDDQRIGHDDVVRLCGDIEDSKISAILGTGATMEELEEAVAWSIGQDDLMGEERKPLSGNVAQIYEILISDLFDDEEARRD